MSLNKKNCHTDDNGCLCFSGGKQGTQLSPVSWVCTNLGCSVEYIELTCIRGYSLKWRIQQKPDTLRVHPEYYLTGCTPNPH